jgi:hypothetical protein
MPKIKSTPALALLLAAVLAAGCASAKPKDLSGNPSAASAAKAGSVGPGDRGAPIMVGPDIIVEAPVDEAWTVLSDVENWGAWNPKVTQVTPGAGLNTGSELEWSWEEKKIHSTVTAYKQDELLTIKGCRSGSDASLRWVLRNLGPKKTLVSLRALLSPGANATLIANAGNETQAWILALQDEMARRAAARKPASKKKAAAKG